MTNHRYVLTRNWGFTYPGKVLNWIMLNPSTADDVFDDATIRRCIGFSKRWGFDGMVVTNLCAYRATDPKGLARIWKDNRELAIGGADNARHIQREAAQSHSVVCAWGDNCDLVFHRDLDVVSGLRDRDLLCIRRTAKGNPAHPVRERYTDKPEVFFSRLLVGRERDISVVARCV
jgi:hypothetical protein